MSDAATEPTRTAGIRRLEGFVAQAGTDYTKGRNFDFGPDRRGNVSMLSPYLRHRLVLEAEVLQAALTHHSRSAASKFVDEVFWRAYFKGWLEHRPQVWVDYREDVARLVRELEADDDLRRRYESAIHGETGIECFDSWTRELVATGYLHNHTRMWFASIWVFTLGLPWQLGADFFYRNLVDGDPASNTLSWRWVCGLHTKGKTYLARASNIARFTNNRFDPRGQLASHAPALEETKAYPAESLVPAQTLPRGKRVGLLVTEEDCCAETLLSVAEPVAILGVLATEARSPLPVSGKVRAFASGAVADAVERAGQYFGVGGEVASSDDWTDLLVEWAAAHAMRVIATPYAPAGPVAERLAEAGKRLASSGVELLQLRRTYDDTTWPHAQRGFFRLRQQIPAILDRLAISAGSGKAHSHS